MIVRIVKMTFMPNQVAAFLDVFSRYKEFIQSMDGCTHLQLLSDINCPNIYFTYSHWQTEEDLNNYRNSELFKNVWSQTKVLFEKKAEAWSLKEMN